MGVKIEYTVELKAPAISGQSGTIGKDFDIVTKVEDGKPYFSGAQIKGILRENVIKFSKALNKSFLVEKYFGKSGDVSCGMRFSSLILDDRYSKKKCLDSRYGIRIDRESKTTEDNSLFLYQYVRAGLSFKGTIEIFEEIEEKELEFLCSCLKRIDYIGGLKSKGLGKVEIEVTKKERNNENERKRNLKDKNYKEYEYIVIPEENLILTEKEIGNQVMTNDYIQGGTLRGAIISILSKKVGYMDLNEVIENLKVSQGLPKDSFVAMGSIFESKYPLKDGKKKRVNKLLHKNQQNIIDGEEIKLERYGSPIVESNFNKLSLEKNSEINISIDSNSQTAKDGALFSKEILLVKGKQFSGKILITEELYKILNDIDVYIGKNRSKGFGKCKLKLNKVNKDMEKIDISKLEKLSQEISRGDRKYFTVDFISDMILPFNDTDSVGEKIKELIGLDDIVWEREKSFIDIKSINGFNQLNNIRKSREFSIVKGGVLTFSVKEFTDSLIEKLNEVQQKGIGTRKLEGFGEIEISSCRHLEVE